MKFAKKVSLIIVVLVFLSLFLDFHLVDARKISYPDNLWMGILGEAVSEGDDGMYAVACAYRNRLIKGMPLGCAALKRPDLDKFVKKQGKKYEEMAKKIIREVFEGNGPDITRGATHYENVEKFGLPSWAKNMEITAKIGNHTFFAKK